MEAQFTCLRHCPQTLVTCGIFLFVYLVLLRSKPSYEFGIGILTDPSGRVVESKISQMKKLYYACVYPILSGPSGSICTLSQLN